eukprot:CAMPEP_0113944360 /NCGR_PEP_ID=MMETSP1339-20121228/33766_1 /TAXON_ID=94617 /ORGANISM="Fibrocapsa japonica" /LENGTH=133 /DNA_ID=CAMNT_0000949537 /DNA_START=93 /DNA_END=494 /DNA_ORIENTATION=+ /assembly_acc=CAM_ASM_000762
MFKLFIFFAVFSLATAFRGFTPPLASKHIYNPRTSLLKANDKPEAPEGAGKTLNENAEKLRQEAKEKGQSMYSITNLEDMPPITKEDLLPGDWFDIGNLVNIALVGYIAYLFLDSLRLLVFGGPASPPPTPPS